MASTFFFLLANLALLTFIGAAKLLKMTSIYNYLASKVLWSYFLRFLIQQYLTIYMSCLINLYRLDFSA